MIWTVGDITGEVNHVAESGDDVTNITPIDLRQEAMMSDDHRWDYYTFRPSRPANEPVYHVLYFFETGRAGVCQNGNSQWTDCENHLDAFARFITGGMTE